MEIVDQALLRAILNAHRGTTNEFLYLETGTVPIRWILPQRRINFLKHILSRGEDELLKKVYLAQEEKPNQGDFVKLIEHDLKMFELNVDDIRNMPKEVLKKELKKRALSAAFVELYKNMQGSTKVKSIRYERLQLQEYLKSNMSDEVRNTITGLRSKCVKGVKSNFPKLHTVCQHCPLMCNVQTPQLDTQERILVCSALGGSNADYNFIHAGVVDQRYIGKEFSRLIRKRALLLEDEAPTSTCCRLPGADPDQGTTLHGGAAATLHYV